MNGTVGIIGLLAAFLGIAERAAKHRRGVRAHEDESTGRPGDCDPTGDPPRRAGPFMQPFSPPDAHEFIGRVTLGLDPVLDR